MLMVEVISELWSRELAHLQFRNGETVLINGVDDLAGLSVTVGLDHGKGPLSLVFKIVLGEDVSVFYELKLSRMHVDDTSNIEILKVDTACHSLHEHSSVFDVVL